MEKIRKLLASNHWEDTVLALIIGKELLTDEEFQEIFANTRLPDNWIIPPDGKYRMIKKGNSWYCLGCRDHRSLWKSEYKPVTGDIIL